MIKVSHSNIVALNSFYMFTFKFPDKIEYFTAISWTQHLYFTRFFPGTRPGPWQLSHSCWSTMSMFLMHAVLFAVIFKTTELTTLIKNGPSFLVRIHLSFYSSNNTSLIILKLEGIWQKIVLDFPVWHLLYHPPAALNC